MVYSLSRLRRQTQNEDDLKNEDDFKNEDDLKNGDNLKNEEDLKNEDDLTIVFYFSLEINIYYLSFYHGELPCLRLLVTILWKQSDNPWEDE